MPTTDHDLADHRPPKLPPDGTVVTATLMVDPLDVDEHESRTVTGRLETRWVDVFEYWQVVVDGRVVEPDSVATLLYSERRRNEVQA